MAKKMYYSEEEAAEKLGCGVAELATYVSQGKLRVFQDGKRKMYRADEVDAMAPSAAPEEEIVLAPADSSIQDVVSLTEADTSVGAGKEDTVITAEGISIFDDEDLEIEAADPLAETQVAAPLEDQLGSDSVGGGSGLLDLTRESDDTSLGAEILDHIDMEGAIGSSLGAETVPEPEAAPSAAEQPVGAVAIAEVIDPTAGLFSGIIMASCLIMLVIGGVMVSATAGSVPGYLDAMQKNPMIVLIVTVAVVLIGTIAGFFVGKTAAERQIAMRRAGAGS